MKKLRYILCLVALAFLAACSQGAGQSDGKGGEKEAWGGHERAKVVDLDQVIPGAHHSELAVPSGDDQAKPLYVGDAISGEVRSPESGELVGFGLKIGNYNGASKGDLILSICVQTKCEELRQDLKDSVDNNYFIYTLQSPLNVGVGDSVKFSLKHESGEGAVAIWSYPGSDAKLISNDPALDGRQAKTIIYFK
jgi:hypothetical protein